MKQESVNLNDTKAVMEQISKMSEEKAGAEIQAVLEKYTCRLVFQETKQNGKIVDAGFQCVFITGEEMQMQETTMDKAN